MTCSITRFSRRVVLVWLLLAGCTSAGPTVPTASPPAGPTPGNPSFIAVGHCADGRSADHLIVHRRPGLNDEPAETALLTADITSGVQVDRLRRATCALLSFPQGGFFCPIDFGVHLDVYFMDSSGIRLSVRADPGGCNRVIVGLDGTKQALRDNPFWTELASVLRVPVDTLFADR